MNILLYDYHELEERASKHLTVWKAWHTILFICAAVFGILNYTFLQTTMQLVDNNCVFYPKALEFHWVELPNVTMNRKANITTEENTTINRQAIISTEENTTMNTVQPNTTEMSTAINTVQANITEKESLTVNKGQPNLVESTTMNTIQPAMLAKEDNLPVSENVGENSKIVKREATGNETETKYITTSNVTTVEEKNVTIITVNSTHRLMLFTGRSIFGRPGDCQFAEFMPLLSTAFALVWAALFIICPGGGRTRTGLQQPWRILPPALLFALVFVAITGYSFTSTNGGLHAFCAAFSNYTNATTCSPVSQFLERGWNASWSFGNGAAATRAAAAGVWVSWACVAALLLARCIAAPDFVVKRTGVYLVKDPQQKVTPYLRVSPRHSQRSPTYSPTKLENISLKSEPTVTTEVVTASVDHGSESDPTSLATTPVKAQDQH